MIIQLSLNSEISKHFEFIPAEVLEEVVTDLIVKSLNNSKNTTTITFDTGYQNIVSEMLKSISDIQTPVYSNNDTSAEDMPANVLNFRQVEKEEQTVVVIPDNGEVELDDDILALMK